MVNKTDAKPPHGPNRAAGLVLSLATLAAFCIAPPPALANETLAAARCTIVIHAKDAVQPDFGGVGYHVFHHVHPMTPEHWEQVVGKRWRELNPSFARLTHRWHWSPAQFETVARHLAFLKSTGTEVYLATWNPKDTVTPEDRNAYAKLVVDQLEHLVRDKGLANIKYYCMTNELSLRDWAELAQDLPKFRDYHRALFEELRRRRLDIKLLASDASPIDLWNTIEWAAKNMDEITGIYGGHHYINEFRLDDVQFYPWFLGKMQWGVGIARAKNKQFILGEFGAKQDGRTIGGIKQDRCIYWDTPEEPLVPIQVGEAAIAALNAGTYALGYWTFTDFPDAPGARYVNKWGLFRWSGKDYSTRPIYYAYGLLSKFFRGPATVYRIDSDDPLLRIAALQHHDRKTWSIVIVNRKRQAAAVGLRLEGSPLTAAFRKYVYDPAHAPWHPFGDLPGPVGKVQMSQGQLTDTVGAGTLTVYTTAYQDTPPAAIKGLTITRTDGGKTQLQWEPSPETDLCYYRVYRTAGSDGTIEASRQIASTIATRYVDEAADASSSPAYRVVAVDQSGNAGR